jgi:integrase
MEYIPNNPLQKISNFKDIYDFNKPEEKIQYYTVEEYKKFISFLDLKSPKDWAFYTFFSIAFYTGMRKGEINALRWCDIKGDILSVTRSVAQKVKGKQNIFTPPKNASSQRKLQIPKPLLLILEEQKKVQQKEFKKWNENMLVCGGENPLRDTSLSNKNIELSQKAELRTIRIHDFRHTHATLLINEGINIQEIARRLGHSNANITLKVYAHLYPREEERAIKILNRI